jgi:spore coat protein U-like protein
MQGAAMRMQLPGLLTGLFLSVFSSLAFSGTMTQTFAVTAVIPASCTAVTASAMAFGNYDPTSALPLSQTSTIGVTCNLGVPLISAQ